MTAADEHSYKKRADVSDGIQMLIVDDETRFLKTLKQRLEIRGFEITAVSGGSSAVAAMRHEQFDLALLDLKMPGMDGEELLKVIKEKDPLIEVIILTGHGSLESAEGCTKAGSYRYLQKPCETGELLEVLKDAYQKRVQRKLDLDDEQVKDILRVETGASPLETIRRLRTLEQNSSSKKLFENSRGGS